jgi:glutamyl-tRNA reductase
VGPEHEGNRLAGAAAELFGLEEAPARTEVGPNVVVQGGKG